MYVDHTFLDKALPENIKWPSDEHKQIAIALLLNNPNIVDINQLKLGVINILNIPEERIPTLSPHDLQDYGFEVTFNVKPR